MITISSTYLDVPVVSMTTISACGGVLYRSGCVHSSAYLDLLRNPLFLMDSLYASLFSSNTFLHEDNLFIL